MVSTLELRKRIKVIEDVINSSSIVNLETKIKGEEDFQMFQDSLSWLNELKESYNGKIDICSGEIQSQVKSSQLISEVAEKCFNGNCDYARKELSKGGVRKRFYINSIKAIGCGILSCLSAPFLRKESIKNYEYYRSYCSLSQSALKRYNECKQIEQRDKERFKNKGIQKSFEEQQQAKLYYGMLRADVTEEVAQRLIEKEESLPIILLKYLECKYEFS